MEQTQGAVLILYKTEGNSITYGITGGESLGQGIICTITHEGGSWGITRPYMGTISNLTHLEVEQMKHEALRDELFRSLPYE